MMDSDRIDLSPLALPELTRERMARAVLARVYPSGARGPLGVLAGWARPGIAAAAAIAALSLVPLLGERPRAAEAARPLTIAEGLRLPAPAADWIARDRAPTEADLLDTWEP
jgi:hypothetical protein